MDWRFQMPSFRFPLRLGILWLLWGAGSAPGQAIQTPVRASWTEESSTTATLLWDRPAAGRGTVRYGLTTNYTHVARDGGGVWRHLVVLRGLEPGARYFYEASSTDANAPMAAGVPAITIGGGGKGGRAHSLDEWVDMEKAGGVKGMSVGLAAILAVAGVD